MAHETCTNSSREASCATAEVFALQKVFGNEVTHLLIASTKGYTGHAMGVAFEEAVGVQALFTGKLPPVANLAQPDTGFESLQFSKGGSHDRQYVLRFAGGFGSQVAFSFYQKYID